ncbi:Uncharacterised protein [Escherichia coli]|uniref:Uncharacterized protein n=1 Tax=Escherichia coli TaxID=562 RepID=A0A2X3K4F7_ECOLX|nr:Uncharacterised protein [Escherichia coli]
MMIDSMAVLDIFILAAKAAANHNKEYRNEEDCQYRCGHHPAITPYLLRSVRAGTSTSTDNQRHNAEDKRQRGHQDRT